MFLFLSFMVAVISLYYLGIMASTYNADTTYLMPLVALLIYSVTNIIRELKRTTEWLLGDEPDCHAYGHAGGRSDVISYSNYAYNSSSYNSADCRYYPSKHNENVENFVQDKKVNKDNEKVLVHYPSRQEVREKIKMLEKSRWFRIHRSIGNFLGYDITLKYYKPRKVKSDEKVKPFNKENNSRYMPPLVKRECEEYNEVAKFVGRSCEIAFNDENIENENK